MDLQVHKKDSRYGDGEYEISASGCTYADLFWGAKGERLAGWTPFARVALDKEGTGSFIFTGKRAVPPGADAVIALAGGETAAAAIEPPAPFPEENPLRVAVMSDIHLSRKTFRGKKAFELARQADLILIPGDLTNDGTPEQLQRMQHLIQMLPATPVLAVTGNHDVPRFPTPRIPRGLTEFSDLEQWLLQRQPHAWEQDVSGAWSVSMDRLQIIGLNMVTHFRKFTLGRGDQLQYLKTCLEDAPGKLHLILCHAPLKTHNPQEEGRAYFDRNTQLQQILDSHENVIFLSGHTHISLNSPCNPVQEDRGNLYINDGSVCRTDLITGEQAVPPCYKDGNILWLYIYKKEIYITGQSLPQGDRISRGCYRFPL